MGGWGGGRGGMDFLFDFLFISETSEKGSFKKKRKGFLIVISPLLSFTLSQMFFPWGILADRPRIITAGI